MSVRLQILDRPSDKIIPHDFSMTAAARLVQTGHIQGDWQASYTTDIVPPHDRGNRSSG
jgi:hypothetical protein